MKRSNHDGKPALLRDKKRPKPVLITGGAGFIGSNLAQRLLAQGREVVLYDNLSRPGVERNAEWLAREFGKKVSLVVADTRDQKRIKELVQQASAVFHFAAQVAVTTSLVDPIHDFSVNVQGTLNILEALRALKRPPPLLYTSTNKVYGGLTDVPLEELDTRVTPCDDALRKHGVDESRRLDFHSPYGCSKGAADQYVLDYARSFGLPAAVFRMSCIYGPRQFGTEDQGWVAHFLIRALSRQPITLYGDGKQVRDLLFVSDLIDAMLMVEQDMEHLGGEAYNMGGGPQNVMSLLELLELAADITGECPRLQHAAPRVGDQRYYVSNSNKFFQRTKWRPRVRCEDGVEALCRWLEAEQRSRSTNGRAKRERQVSAAP